MSASYSTTSFVPDQLLAGDADDILATKITLAAGQVQPRGALLGKVTASGKFILSAAAAQDGSQVPDMILAEAADASGGDLEVMAYYRGQFIQEAMTFGVGHTALSVKDGLQDRRNIILVSSVPA